MMINEASKRAFVEKAEAAHGRRYSYEMCDYKGSHTHVCIICPKHGEFWHSPATHLAGYGCKLCRKEAYTEQKVQEFLESARDIHGSKYDYTKIKYYNTKTKLNIICPIHGTFQQSPELHVLRGQGCPDCGIISRANSRSSNTEEFITKSIRIHGDTYDYSLVDYKKCGIDVTICCPIHGDFEQTPENHLAGKGCYACGRISISDSLTGGTRGNVRVAETLAELGIQFLPEFRFDECKYRNKLPFDFYLPLYNILIEYDGKQHFESIEFFGGDEALIYRKKLDCIKTNFAKENDIQLIRIPYTELDRIPDILKRKLGSVAI